MSRKKKKYQHSNYYYNQDLYWQSASYNTELFTFFRNQILQLAMSRFTWLNLPSTCDERFLEWTLLWDGCATIAKKRGGKCLYSTQAVTNGAPNIYNNPIRWRSWGNNGWNFTVDPRNGVLVYDNLARFPMIMGINIWARELVDIIRTKQQNRLHVKMPLIIKAPQEKQLDAMNLFKQAANGEPAIIGTPSMELVDIDVLMTGVEFLGDKLTEDFANTWQQIYSMLGINSLPFKAERQIEDEISSLNKPSEFMALSPLKTRRDAANKINARFSNLLPGELKVVWSSDFESSNYEFQNNIKQKLEVLS